MAAIVSLESVSKAYPLGNLVVEALRDVDLSLERGEFTAIAGPSGSGKTTLLNLIGCVDVPTRGRLAIDGQVTSELSEKALTNLRLHKLGFIFQSFNLVAVLNVFQNVEFPLLLQGELSKEERRRRVHRLVEQVGLEAQLTQRPSELSGGQRQRVAIARALVTEPRIVLADEPTANLDSHTGEAILSVMRQMNEENGTTFIFSTHDPKVMGYARRIVNLVDGSIESDELRDSDATAASSA